MKGKDLPRLPAAMLLGEAIYKDQPWLDGGQPPASCARHTGDTASFSGDRVGLSEPNLLPILRRFPSCDLVNKQRAVPVTWVCGSIYVPPPPPQTAADSEHSLLERGVA